MTIDWQLRMLEAEILALRRELRHSLERLEQARLERDRARETATRLEQELNNPLNYIQVWR